ncbi:hypothetical protein K450DRAFT_222254 [Umbelopsis ramanniana AG]|uniref:Mitochondrial chaperone BCS1 n=1 Tax=Umbelopsis ramanniana AG TaxID=1314678 RepID=A0AAD5EIU6_UMBRA|nr:uncharacterized protein K450DRAFT_222254 [Umbelopsis ramanniana AG]KAI8583676.1 hypothetical protein K450DRAFT_222254 [Umbelopsis ramanniana AG]
MHPRQALFTPQLGLIARNANTISRSYSSLPDPAGTGSSSLGGFVSNVANQLGVGEFATGGLQLAVIGGILAGVRLFGGYFVDYVRKRIIVTANFDSRDESYSWILNWLNEHPYSAQATQFSVSTVISRGGQRLPGEGLDTTAPPVYFLPAYGFHMLRYKNRLIWLRRERPPSNAVANVGQSNAPAELISISTFGRSREPLHDLVWSARMTFLQRDKSRTVVFAADQYGAWRRTQSRPKRPLSTIVISPTVKQRLVSDAKEFLESENFYAERGLPYRRGYLLYGQPGSGKSSMIHSLAGELGLNIYVITLSNKSLTDDTLGELVSDTPSRCLLLIEDVDSAFVQRTQGAASSSVTFSGLLNAIDGVAAQEGRILCMTTNHIERLDPALIRPGRIDVRILFENATQAQAAELFRKFYPRIPEIEAAMMSKEFSSSIPDRQFSMAHLQGYLMGQKNDPVAAVTGITEWVQRHENADEQTTAFQDQPVEDFGNTEMSGASTPSRPSTPNRIPLSWRK